MKVGRSSRHDFSLALLHLTGARNGSSALDALISILREGHIRASGNAGYVKGSQAATCFTEMPLSSVPRLVDHSAVSGHPYEPYGLAIHKQSAFERGARPVIYLPDSEAGWIPPSEQWRHVRFEYGTVDFSHEREWRAPGQFSLYGVPFYVLVRTPSCERTVRASLASAPDGLLGFVHMQYLGDFL